MKIIKGCENGTYFAYVVAGSTELAFAFSDVSQEDAVDKMAIVLANKLEKILTIVHNRET